MENVQDESYYVYILYSAILDRYYVGSCQNPSTRLKKHLGKHSGYTGKAKDWIICLTEPFENKITALRGENEIKGWKSKVLIESLIN